MGFAAANLILARMLSAAEYALFTLVVALVNLGGAIAPAGVDEVVKRHRLETGPRFLRQVVDTGTIGCKPIDQPVNEILVAIDQFAERRVVARSTPLDEGAFVESGHLLGRAAAAVASMVESKRSGLIT